MSDTPGATTNDESKRSVFPDVDGVNERYRAVLNSIDEAFAVAEVVWDKNGVARDYVVLEINSAYEKQLDVRADSVLGKRATELYPSLDQTLLDFLAKVAQTGEQKRIESYNKNADRYFEICGFRITKSQVGVFFKDITARKKSEEALKQSEERFRNIFDNASMGIAVRDLGGRIVDSNPAYQRITGYSREELRGKVLFEFTHPEDAESEMSLMEEVLTGKRDRYELEKRYVRKDGSVMWGHVTGSLISGPNREPIIGIATVEDITERKNAVEELKQSERLYRTVFDNSEDGFILLEPIYDEHGRACDFRFLKANPAYERQTGRKTAVVEGKTAKSVAPTLEPGWVLIVGDVAKTGKSVHYENYNQWTNKWYDAYYFPYGQGQVGILFRDITQRKNLEEQLKEKERLAAIGATAGMVGHDIRNPLQAMINDIYLLKSELTMMPECDTKEGVKESFDSIEKNITYINKIIADLQDYASSRNPEHSNVNFSELVGSICKAVDVPANIELSVDVNGVRELKTDPMFIRRALTNLINNAIQAMPDGGKLSIACFKKKGKVEVTVTDTGVGIPDDLKPKLFTPMVTTKARGKGLGLAVVKRIVEALNGTIRFESEEGKGTVFRIELPTR